jgi:hypothetical protein
MVGCESSTQNGKYNLKTKGSSFSFRARYLHDNEYQMAPLSIPSHIDSSVI